MDGILPLWKPKGLTSHDCVARIRKLAGTKKVGHTGTLDPEVEGVLPICLGKATKLVPYLTDTKKTYEAVVSLGSATETEDATGKVVEESEVPEVADKELMEVLQSFQGYITQIPPMYSAVKVKGRRLYEYAREGVQVERPEREIEISELTLLENHRDGTFKIEVICSKGTYIRTLCVDIGKALGVPAHMKELVRTATGSFRQSECVTFEELENATISEQLFPMQRAIQHLPEWRVTRQQAAWVRNGQRFEVPPGWQNSSIHAVVWENELLALYQNHPDKEGLIKPVRVFGRNE